MSKHSFKDWLIAVRPWSFPASGMPVLVTLAFLHWMQCEVEWLNGLLAFIGVLFFQAGGNAWNDYYDSKNGVDIPDTFAMKTLTNGQFTLMEIRCLAVSLLGIALFIGFLLTLRTGFLLLLIAFGAIGCALLYPWLKYRAWGDILLFIAYAILPTLGVSYVVTGEFLSDVMLIALPVGLITVAILHANNTRDAASDGQVNVTTLATKLGMKLDIFCYIIEVLLPFVWVVSCALIGYFPLWSLLIVAVLPSAFFNVRSMLYFPKIGIGAITNLGERTAKLQLMFSLLFTMTFLF